MAFYSFKKLAGATSFRISQFQTLNKQNEYKYDQDNEYFIQLYVLDNNLMEYEIMLG